MTARAFDTVAATYDRSFTDTPLGRELRRIVWGVLADVFAKPARVLELNCGTGEDALWLAGRGIRVVATDGSPGMLEAAARKAELHQVGKRIEFVPLDIAMPDETGIDTGLDGALSNFGGLNCVQDLRPIARLLARCIRPGGRLILVVMGRWCAWEIVWHLLHFRPRMALRRLSRDGTAGRIGDASLRVWYPPSRSIRRAFGSEFRLRRLIGLGVFLPPFYLQDAIARRQGLFRMLCRLEKSMASARLLRCLGDHLVLDFERTSSAPEGLQ